MDIWSLRKSKPIQSLKRWLSTASRRRLINSIYRNRKKWVIVLGLQIFIEALLYAGLNNSLLESNYQYAKNIYKIAQLKQDNQILENQIAGESALNTIEQKALKKGFIHTQRYIYMPITK